MTRGARESSSRAVAVAWLTGLALLVAAMGIYPPDPVRPHVPAGEAAARGENSAEVRAALEAWKALWDALQAEGVAVLDPQVRTAGARYAGDTCGMRYRRLYSGVASDARERLAIAAFANDPETKRRLLRPLLDRPDARVRARAAVELARVALRLGDPDAAEAALRRSAGLYLPPACEADRHYLEARIAVRRGDPATALESFSAATSSDPGYWNAWRDRLPVLVRALDEPGQGAAACLRRARNLIEVLGVLPQLADDRRQFARLALSLERLGARSSATLLASGVAWSWAGQETLARRALTHALDAPGLLPGACEDAVRARTAIVLEGS